MSDVTDKQSKFLDDLEVIYGLILKTNGDKKRIEKAFKRSMKEYFNSKDFDFDSVEIFLEKLNTENMINFLKYYSVNKVERGELVNPEILLNEFLEKKNVKIFEEEEEEEKEEENEDDDEEEGGYESEKEEENDDEERGKPTIIEEEDEEFTNQLIKGTSGKVMSVDEILAYYKSLETQKFTKPVLSWVVFGEENCPFTIDTLKLLKSNNQDFVFFVNDQFSKFQMYSNLKNQAKHTTSPSIFMKIKKGEYQATETIFIGGFNELESTMRRFPLGGIKILKDDEDEDEQQDRYLIEIVKERNYDLACSNLFTDDNIRSKWMVSANNIGNKYSIYLRPKVVDKKDVRSYNMYSKYVDINDKIRVYKIGKERYYLAKEQFLLDYCMKGVEKSYEGDVLNLKVDGVLYKFNVLYVDYNIITNYVKQNEEMFYKQMEILRNLKLSSKEYYNIIVDNIKNTEIPFAKDNTSRTKKVKQIGENRLRMLMNKDSTNSNFIVLLNDEMYEKSKTLGEYIFRLCSLTVFFEKWNKESQFVKKVKNFEYSIQYLTKNDYQKIKDLIPEYFPEISLYGNSDKKLKKKLTINISKLLKNIIKNLSLEIFSSMYPKDSFNIDINYYKLNQPIVNGDIYVKYNRANPYNDRVNEKLKEKYFVVKELTTVLPVREYAFKGILREMTEGLKTLSGVSSFFSSAASRLLAEAASRLAENSPSSVYTFPSSLENSDSESESETDSPLSIVVTKDSDSDSDSE